MQNDAKKVENYWNPGIWVFIWEYSVRGIWWIPSWYGFKDLCILVLWMKVAIALEGFNTVNSGKFLCSANLYHSNCVKSHRSTIILITCLRGGEYHIQPYINMTEFYLSLKFGYCSLVSLVLRWSVWPPIILSMLNSSSYLELTFNLRWIETNGYETRR